MPTDPYRPEEPDDPRERIEKKPCVWSKFTQACYGAGALLASAAAVITALNGWDRL